MAFTKTPTQDTYDTKRFPFVGAHNSRDKTGSKDQRYINCYPESIKNPLNNGKRIYLVKRPGLNPIVNTANTGEARGLIYWNSKIYSVVGAKVFSNTTLILTLATSTGFVGFQPANASSTGTSNYLFLCDGTNGYTIDTSDAVTQINQTYSAWAGTTAYSLTNRRVPTVANSLYYEVTTAGTSAAGEPTWPTTIGNTVVDGTVTWTCKGYYGGFPSPHIPTPVFADGYIFLPKASSDWIYNCDLDLPQSWNPINHIAAEMFPDNIVALGRNNNQVVAFGTNSTEFFYDAANVNQSPLARNDGGAQQIGCSSATTLVTFEQQMLFVGQSELGGRCVWFIDSFKPTRVSIEWVDDALDQESTNLANSKAYIIRVRGHQFYILNLTSRTFVYDLDEKMWHEWSSNSSGSHAVFSVNYSCDWNGEALGLHATNGKVYKFDPYTYQDDGTAILVDATTSLIDMDDMDRKCCRMFVLVCDRTSASSFATVSYSDNDYVSFSAGRAIDLSTRAFLSNLGMFRRRAFKVTYTDNFPFRAEAIELYTNKHGT